MTLALIPQPKKIQEPKGTLSLPVRGTIGIGDTSLFLLAENMQEIFKRYTISILNGKLKDTVSIKFDKRLRIDGYKLKISCDGVEIAAQNVAGANYAFKTLKQIAAQSPKNTLPFIDIDDWPDFPVRGVYYDICRGRVPKLERLYQQIDMLADAKINHFQLYIEHTFRFRLHPDIGKGADPLTAEDIMKLDKYCVERGIEMVPSLASFGHLATVLKHKQYHHLAEDYGIGKYASEESCDSHGSLKKGWSLSPANPKIYEFLDQLFSEFLPCFSSQQFNVCCDETWDLGYGQSHDLCKKKGKGVVYMDHILMLHKLCKKYDRKMMFWGDIIRKYPKLIKKIPKDVTVLDWAYHAHHDYETIKDFKKAGVPFYACPGTSSWVTLFPRIHEAMANIHGFAAAGKKHGASGLLNTDWGDGGHWHFMELSWHGFLFGAEQAWNVDADMKSFTKRFAKIFFNTDNNDMVDAITELGDITHLKANYKYQSIWTWIFYNDPKEYKLFNDGKAEMWSSKNGKISVKKDYIQAKHGREALSGLKRVRKVFEKYSKVRRVDPIGVLPYWIFAVDNIIHAAKKLTVIGPGGKDTPAARKELKKDMALLMKRFEKLWMARNRKSEIRITLNKYKRAMAALDSK